MTRVDTVEEKASIQTILENQETIITSEERAKIIYIYMYKCVGVGGKFALSQHLGVVAIQKGALELLSTTVDQLTN